MNDETKFQVCYSYDPICNKLETLAEFANSLDVANNELYICIFQLQALQSLKSICMDEPSSCSKAHRPILGTG